MPPKLPLIMLARCPPCWLAVLLSSCPPVLQASTIHGYEGTGRSLSIKLIQQLRKENVGAESASVISASGARVLREITLETPIRYAAGDPVEAWLEGLLCLKASVLLSSFSLMLMNELGVLLRYYILTMMT